MIKRNNDYSNSLNIKNKKEKNNHIKKNHL